MKGSPSVIGFTDAFKLKSHRFIYGQSNKSISPFKDEALKISVKERFMDFIDEHTNSHGVFICGSKKLVDFVNENLI